MKEENIMKKMKTPEPIASMPLSNTAAVVISEIDDFSEKVKYYIATSSRNDTVDVHQARIYYRASDGEPFFNSHIGRMMLNNFMKC